MREKAEAVNEVVIYSAFGWADAEKRNTVTGEDIGRYVTYLVSDAAAEIRGSTVHLRTLDDVRIGREALSSTASRSP
jgi:hypothetical protein